MHSVGYNKFIYHIARTYNETYNENFNVLNSPHISHLRQQCHNNRVTTTVSQQQCHNSVTTTESQLKIYDFSGEMFKGAIIFYECNDDTAALQRQVLQTAL